MEAPRADTIPPVPANGGAVAESSLASDRAMPASDASAVDTAQAGASEPGDGALWAAVGAGALLLAGGVAMASRRRRSIPDAAVDDRGPVIESNRVAPPPPAPQAAMAVTPASGAGTGERTAAVAARRPTAAAVAGSQAAMVDAMAAEAPSAANPFLTRRNRRRRAEFLLRTGAADAPVVAGSEQVAAADADRIQTDRYGSFKIGGRLAPRPGRRIVPG